MPETFSPPPRVSDLDMHHGLCVIHVSWCMPGSLTSGFFWSRWRGKSSWHSRCMRNTQFYVSCRRPMKKSQVLGSTSIPARLHTLVYWESFSWLTGVGTTRNTVNRLGWARTGLAVLILNAAGAGLIGWPAVISGRYNKCHSLQLQNHYAHFPPLQHTHIHARHSYAELVMGNDHGFQCIVCWPWQEASCVIG